MVENRGIVLAWATKVRKKKQIQIEMVSPSGELLRVINEQFILEFPTALKLRDEIDKIIRKHGIDRGLKLKQG